MHIEHIGKTTVKVTVTGEEMKKIGLTYDDISEDNELTMTLISNLIEKVFPKIKQQNPRSIRMNVEIFPLNDSGCIFYITPEPKCALNKKTLSLITAYSLAAFLKISKELMQLGIAPSDCIVTGEFDCLRMLIRLPEIPPLKGLISSYVSVTDATDEIISYALEHGQTLIKGNAVEQLSSYIL